MPEMSKVQLNMALISSKKFDNEDDAMSHLNRAVRLDPYLALAFFERAIVHSKLGECSCALLDLDTSFKVVLFSFYILILVMKSKKSAFTAHEGQCVYRLYPTRSTIQAICLWDCFQQGIMPCSELRFFSAPSISCRHETVATFFKYASTAIIWRYILSNHVMYKRKNSQSSEILRIV
jgi:hypothetical protein